MMAPDLFQLNPNSHAEMRRLGGQIPIVLIDEVFASPAAIRETALGLSFDSAPYSYPGRAAQPDQANPSLNAFRRMVLKLVNREYLPRVPTIFQQGEPISEFSRVETDFAVVDLHPDDLQPLQRKPHVDGVPIFGLVYLDPQERGGTLFFTQTGEASGDVRRGYFSEPDEEYALVGKIEGRFNRLAIYPGFVPHSGEIVGDWIRTDERFSDPRLTQRLLFFP